MATELTGKILSTRYGRDGRSKTSEIETDEPNVVLSVITFHKHGGDYVSTASGVRHVPREEGDVFSVSKSSPMDFVSFGRQTIGKRFSTKNLDAAHTDVLLSVAATSIEKPDAYAKVLSAVPGEKD